MTDLRIQKIAVVLEDGRAASAEHLARELAPTKSLDQQRADEVELLTRWLNRLSERLQRARWEVEFQRAAARMPNFIVHEVDGTQRPPTPQELARAQSYWMDQNCPVRVEFRFDAWAPCIDRQALERYYTEVAPPLDLSPVLGDRKFKILGLIYDAVRKGTRTLPRKARGRPKGSATIVDMPGAPPRTKGTTSPEHRAVYEQVAAEFAYIDGALSARQIEVYEAKGWPKAARRVGD